MIVGSWKSCFKIFEFKVSGTKRDVVPNDRFPSAETISMSLLLLFLPGQPQDSISSNGSRTFKL